MVKSMSCCSSGDFNTIDLVCVSFVGLFYQFNEEKDHYTLQYTQKCQIRDSDHNEACHQLTSSRSSSNFARIFAAVRCSKFIGLKSNSPNRTTYFRCSESEKRLQKIDQNIYGHKTTNRQRKNSSENVRK